MLLNLVPKPAKTKKERITLSFSSNIYTEQLEQHCLGENFAYKMTNPRTDPTNNSSNVVIHRWSFYEQIPNV